MYYYFGLINYLFAGNGGVTKTHSPLGLDLTETEDCYSITLIRLLYRFVGRTNNGPV